MIYTVSYKNNIIILNIRDFKKYVQYLLSAANTYFELNNDPYEMLAYIFQREHNNPSKCK